MTTPVWFLFVAVCCLVCVREVTVSRLGDERRSVDEIVSGDAHYDFQLRIHFGCVYCYFLFLFVVDGECTSQRTARARLPFQPLRMRNDQ